MESPSWPKELTNLSAAEALSENKLKYTYTDEMFDEEEVISLIKNNLIDLKNCFPIMDNVIYRKLRFGITKVHPPPVQHKRRKRMNSLHWESRKFNLINTYREINSHILLMNGHDMKQQQNIEIQGYTTYNLTHQVNSMMGVQY